MLNIVLTVVVVAVPLWMLAATVYGYLAAPGTKWERLVAALKGSASLLWTRLNALSIGAVGLVTEVSSFAGAPGIKEAIEPWLAPQYMTAYVVFVLLGAEIARRRTLPT